MQEMGEKGHQFVRDNFLTTRHLRDYLTLIISLLKPSNDRRIEIKNWANSENSQSQT
jgi:trehalose synthase